MTTTRTRLLPKLLAWALAVTAGLLPPACTTVPDIGARSPLAAAVEPGAPEDLTRALDEDPPLPDARRSGWDGLAPTGTDRPATTHGGHHGH